MKIHVDLELDLPVLYLFFLPRSKSKQSALLSKSNLFVWGLFPFKVIYDK